MNSFEGYILLLIGMPNVLFLLPVNRLSKDYFGHLQVCAYKNGKVVIDTAAGVLGKYDPRPVQPDSLFPVFSVTKGITAGMVHWLVDKGYDSVYTVIKVP